MDNGPAKRASKLASLCKRRGFTVFGNKKPEADGLNHLKIVTMIFHEVLRLYPLVAMLHRAVYKDTQVGDMCLQKQF
ncbi:unnamed protein product, partial [Vitis vinifera]|uniref:Uncharacterized protein n=1 Tax=Vitis vinifera TaxID=29760 RepID=D7UAX9_VITVI